MKKILVAMSGGVDSAVSALLLKQAGYDVTGVTMKLWGGPSDVGCCSVSDVEDARRVADHIDIPHFVFNFGRDFQAQVVDPYISAHKNAETPNPCIECNRQIKFKTLTTRAKALGFDAVATGHHAQIIYDKNKIPWLMRGADPQKDQSYVLNMLTPEDLTYTMFPIGHLAKSQVRKIAASNNLRLAQKPDSYEVCFIQKSSGRQKFLSERIEPTPAQVVDTAGNNLGDLPAMEFLTVGQRKGVTGGGSPEPLYVLSVRPEANDDKVSQAATVVVGKKSDLLSHKQTLKNLSLRNHTTSIPEVANSQSQDIESKSQDIESISPESISPESSESISPEVPSLEVPGLEVLVQSSAHGTPALGKLILDSDDDTDTPPYIRWREPQKLVAPGQSLVFYNAVAFASPAFEARTSSGGRTSSGVKTFLRNEVTPGCDKSNNDETLLENGCTGNADIKAGDVVVGSALAT